MQELPRDAHMAFLESLDIDGVSEHSQLFRLESEQVSRLLRESVRKRVEDMDFGRLLRGEGDSGSELGEELSDAIEEAMRDRVMMMMMMMMMCWVEW